MNRNTEEDETTSCISSCSTGNVSSLSTGPETPSTSVIATTSSAVTPTSIPSTSMHMHSSTPLHEIKLYASESIDTNYDEFSYSEFNNDRFDDDEIILTKELFANIINISPEELKEDSKCNEPIDEDHADDFEINELFTFMQNARVETSSTSDCENTHDIVQEEGLQYVAGYVAHRFKKKYPHLGERTGIINDTTETSWLKVVSKGNLMCPSIQLLRMSRLVNRCFQEFHGDYFSKEDFVIQKVVALVKQNDEYNECIPEEVLQCLVRTRTYIRVRDINKRAYTKNDERKKKRKMKKLN